MRLLHTSDWHIGRSLHGADLLADQEAVLAELARVVADERVDAVLVAGDVYDRAIPSADADRRARPRRCCGCAEAGAAVVLTPATTTRPAGSAFAAGLLAVAGVHLRATTPELDRPVLLRDAHGEVAVYGLPYLEPEVARHELGLPGRAATRRCSTRPWTGCAPTSPRGRAPGASSWRTPSSAGPGRATASATSAWAGWTSCPRPSSTASTTGRWATCTARSSQRPAALQRLAAGVLLRRGRAAEARLAGRPGTRRARAR